MTTPTITSDSDIVGATGVVLTITFQNIGTVKANGHVIMTFPYYVSTTSMVSGTPTCSNNNNMNAGMTCVFSSNTLTISNPVTSDETTVKTFSFKVTNCRNPYNGKSKTGFTIYTTDSSGGQIDYSDALSLKVNTPGTFGSSEVTLSTSEYTVGEDTELTIGIKLPLPLDANCRVRVTFPTDMPLDSGYLIDTNGGGGFFDRSVDDSVYSSSGGTTSFYYDACSAARLTPSAGVNSGDLVLTGVPNKLYVETTLSFTVVVLAMDGGIEYPIYTSSGVSIVITTSSLTTGTITSFGLTAVDGYV